MFSTTWNNKDWIYSPALENLENHYTYIYTEREEDVHICDSCFQTLNYKQCMKGNKVSQPYNCSSLSPGVSFQAVTQEGGTQLKASSLTGKEETNIDVQQDQDL